MQKQAIGAARWLCCKWEWAVAVAYTQAQNGCEIDLLFDCYLGYAKVRLYAQINMQLCSHI